jgi:peptidyl-prolyl cis-trans isomerase B (cyclophilin B)
MTVNAIIKRRPLILVIAALAIGLILGFVIGRALGATSSGGNPRAEIIMESGGTIVVELDPASAPITVKNFIALASDGFYNGLTFHRIIPGFMIQGGDPDGTGTGGSSSPIKGEFSANGITNNISHGRGVISMARRGGDNDSATSQFFITNTDRPDLDGQYAAFGRVIEGMEVIDMISAVPTDSNARPLTPVVIKSIKVIK